MDDEWFKKGKDETAAAQEFLEIFKTADKNVRVKLINIFVAAFRKEYKEKRDFFIQCENSEDTQSFQSRVANEFSFPTTFLAGFEKKTPEKQAEMLGKSLGSFLAAVEYGLTSEKCSNIAISPYGQWIINAPTEFAKRLNEINKKAKQKFIRNRVNKIAQKHAGKLSESQQSLIAGIASRFI